jgi:hypothetical protein
LALVVALVEQGVVWVVFDELVCVVLDDVPHPSEKYEKK